MLTYIIELHAGNDSRRVTGKYLAARIDQYGAAAPSPHAGLWITGVIIRHHTIDSHTARKPFLRLSHNAQAVFQLATLGNQAIPIFQRPTVVLGVRNF